MQMRPRLDPLSARCVCVCLGENRNMSRQSTFVLAASQPASKPCPSKRKRAAATWKPVARHSLHSHKASPESPPPPPDHSAHNGHLQQWPERLANRAQRVQNARLDTSRFSLFTFHCEHKSATMAPSVAVAQIPPSLVRGAPSGLFLSAGEPV